MSPIDTLRELLIVIVPGLALEASVLIQLRIHNGSEPEQFKQMAPLSFEAANLSLRCTIIPQCNRFKQFEDPTTVDKEHLANWINR